jgi:prepilin-type N-terminal cleavage/methylation domain-containing protein
VSDTCTRSSARRGFTLIEVLGALVVFSVGVLMVTSMTSSLSERMRYASLRTAVTIVGQERLDSLALVDYDSASPGVTTGRMTVLGEAYDCRIAVSQDGVVTRRVRIDLDPVDGSGPTFEGVTVLGRSW